jgi:hypothetical protein
METSSYRRRHPFDLGVGRRLIHVVLLVLMIAAVRACGGATQAEDRLDVVTRWVAEKTGLGSVMATWDTTLRPPIAAVTTKMSNGIYDGLSRTLDVAEYTADTAVTWAADTARNAMAAVGNRMRATLTPGRKDEPADKRLEGSPANNSPSQAR